MINSRLEQARETITRFRNLGKSPEWEQLVEYANGQIERRRNELELKPLREIGEVLFEQYLKGEIAGVRLFLAMPEIILSEAEAIESALVIQSEGEEHGTERRDTSIDDGAYRTAP